MIDSKAAWLRAQISLFFFLVLLFLARPAFAGDSFWYGASNSTWETAGNWQSPDNAHFAVPTSSDVAWIGGISVTHPGAPDFPTISVNAAGDVASSLQLIGTLNIISGASLTVGFAKIGEVLSGALNVSGTFTQTSSDTEIGFFGSGSITVNNGGIVNSPIITARGGSVTINSGGTINTKQMNEGTLILAGGTLKASAATATLLSSGTRITVTSTIDTNGFDTQATGLISNVGGLQKAGTGTLTLMNGGNSYSGGTLVSAGTLKQGANNAFVDDTAYVVNTGGTLDLNDFGVQVSALSGTGGTVDLGTATMTVKQSTNTSYAGAIIGTGAVDKQSAGTLTLSGTNTFSGGLSIKGGIVSVASNAALGDTSTGTLKLDGGTLQATAGFTQGRAVTLTANDGTFDVTTGTLIENGAISGAGDLTKTGAGQLTLNVDNTYTGNTIINGGILSIATNARLGGTSGTLTINGATLQGTADLTMNRATTIGASGAIFDVSSGANVTQQGIISGTTLTKTGAGKLTLSAVNTYTGATAINGGTISITADSGLGDTTTPASLTLAGGTLQTTGSAFATSRLVTLGTGGGTFDVSSGGLTLNGVISGSTSLTKTGASTLTLTQTNTYSGGTALNDGTVSVASNANLGNTAGTLTFGGGTLATTANITMNRGTTLNSGDGTFDVASGTTLTQQGVITGSIGSLTKTSAGTLILSGTNTYSTGTVINGGKVQVAADANLGQAASTLTFGGGTLATTADINMSRGTTFNAGGGTFDVASGTSLTMNGAIGGTGALTKNNAGQLTLTNNSSTYSGGTTLNTGTIVLGASGALGTGALTVGGDSTLQTGASNISLANTITIGLGSHTLTVNTTSTNVMTLNGQFTSNGSVIKSGTGKLTLAGDSSARAISYTINGGTLGLGGTVTNFLGTGGITLGGAATLQATSATPSINNAITFGGNTLTMDTNGNTLTYAGLFSDNGTLTKIGAGTLTLSGNNSARAISYNLNAGTLALAGATNLLGTGSITMGGNATIQAAAVTSSFNNGITLAGNTLTLDTNGNTMVWAGVFSDNGSVTKTGAGQLSLQGNNSARAINYLFNAGSVQLGNAATNFLGTGSVTLGGDVTMQVGTSTALDNNFALGGNTLTVNTSTNSLTLNGQIANGSLTKSGTTTLTLSGNSSYAGTTTLGAGTVKATTNANALGASSLLFNGGNLSLANDTGLNFGRNATVSSDTTITSDRLTSGAGVTHTLGTLSIGNNKLTVAAGSNVASGTAGLTFGATTLSANGAVFDTGASTLLMLSALGGNFSFTKQGNGNLTLTSASTRSSGGTTLTAGTLQLENGDALGTNASGALALNGGTLKLVSDTATTFRNTATTVGADSSITVDRATVGTGVTHIMGTLSLGNNQLTVGPGTHLLTGGFGLVFGATTLTANGAVFNIGNVTTLTLGALSGNFSFTKQGNGNLTLTSASTRSSGGTTLSSGGVLRLENGDALGTNTAGALALNGGALSVASDTATTFRNTATTVGADTQISVDRLTSGAGVTQTMGTLSVGNNMLSISSGLNVTSGTAGLTFGATTFSASGTTFSVGNNALLTLGALNDGGTATKITKLGSGAMTLATAPTSLVDGTEFDLRSGTLNLSNGALGTLTKLTFLSAATVSLGGNETLGAVTGNAGTVAVGANTLTLGSTNNLDSSFGGGITGNGTLNKAGTGTATLSGTSSFSGATNVNAGKLRVTGNLGSSAVTVKSGTILGGSGTIGVLTVKNGGTLGDSSAIESLSVTNGATFESGSTFSLDGNGSLMDSLSVGGAVNILSGALLSFNLQGPLTGGSYTLLTGASGLDGTIKFTLSGAVPTGYRLDYAGTSLNLVLQPIIGAITVTPDNPTIITGGSTNVTITVGNAAAQGGGELNPTVTGDTNISGTGTTSSPVAPGDTGTITPDLVFDGTTVGQNQTGTVTVTDPNASNNPQTGSITVTVLDHSDANLSVTSGNNQTVITGASGITAGLTLANGTTGQQDLSPLDVQNLGTGVTGTTGSAVVASGSTGSYTSALDTSTVGANQTQTFTLDAGDEQDLPGANPLTQQSAGVTITVLDHADPTLTIASGNNQTVIVGASNITSSLNLANGTTDEQNLSPMDVQNLSSGLTGTTGSAVVGSGSSGTYTAALDTSTVGQGQQQTFSLSAGDDQSLAGANALSTKSVDVTLTVLDHAAPGISIASGNNQQVIVGATGVTSTLNLANGTSDQQNLSPMDVANLSNGLTGTTGSGVIASGASGNYTAALDTSTVGMGQQQSFSLDAGDQQTLAGASALTTQSETITLDVFGHAAPDLTITSGNNRTVITGATGITAGLTLANGTNGQQNLSPMDVANLSSGLTGTTGSGVIASGSTGSYTAALDTSTVGANMTQTFTLDAGDDQRMLGADALAQQSADVTITVLGHAAPALTIASGNNQTVIIGATGITSTLKLANGTTGQQNLSPMDVQNLSSGLTGTTGSAVVASGSSGNYTAALDTSAVGLAQQQNFSLDAGDDQSLDGADALSRQDLDVTLNVLDHAAPDFTIASGNSQQVIVGATGITAILKLANGTTGQQNLSPMDVTTLSSGLTGTTGNGVIASGASGNYTAALNTSTVGAGQTQDFTLKAGDQQTLAGADALTTQSQTVDLDVYGHAAPSLSGTTFDFGNVHLGYTTPVVTATQTVTNGLATDYIVDLKGNGVTVGNYSFNTFTGVAAGDTSTIAASLATGQGVGVINQNLNYTYGDDSTLAGAVGNIGFSTLTVTGQVYSGQGIWNAQGGGSWGTIASGFGLNWQAGGGSPGLDAAFSSTDTATFGTAGGGGTVTLDGAAPSIKDLIFNDANDTYMLTQGSGGTVTLNGGNGVATIQNKAGTHSISAPISLATNTKISVTRSQDVLNISGDISGSGNVEIAGAGRTVYTNDENYIGSTTVTSGALASKSLLSSDVVLNGGAFSPGGTGTPTIIGVKTLTLNGGKLEMDLGPLETSDAILSTGTITLGAATQFVFKDQGFEPGVYTLLNGPTLSGFGDLSLLTFTSNIAGLRGLFGVDANNLYFRAWQNGVKISGAVLSNSAPYLVDPLADFLVAGDVVTLPTNGSNTINALFFAPNSVLTINNNLTITSGNLTVNSGSAMTAGGTIVTPGDFTKLGGGLLSVFSNIVTGGNTVISDGKLAVNGVLTTHDVLVGINAWLKGSGMINGNVINSGTTAPGNSPGTLTINGSFTQSKTGTFQLEVASTSLFDRLIVSGNASLNGRLQVAPYQGFKFQYGQQFAFLQAKSISGKFSEITMPNPETMRGRFVTNGGTGTLVVAPASYTLVAQNQNQVNVAKALNHYIPAQSGDKQTVSTALDLQTADQYSNAFNAISPAFYQSLSIQSTEQAVAQSQMIAQRLSAVRLGVEGFDAQGIDMPLTSDKDGKSVMDAKDKKNVITPANATNWGLWVQGNGIFSNVTNVSNMPNYRFESGGFMGGADYRWNEGFTTGLYAGYQGTYSKYANGGSNNTNSTLFGLYATYQKEGFYSDAIVGGSYNNYDVRRPISFSTIDRTAHSNVNGGQLTSYLDFGYDWHVSGFTFGPLASAQYTYTGLGGFTESGADSLDLRVNQQNTNSLRSNFGGRVAYTWTVAKGIVIVPEVRMFWQHEYLESSQSIGASLDGGAGPGFDYTTSVPGRDSVFAGAGISVQVGPYWNGLVYYNASFGRQDYTSQMISTGLGWKF